MLIIILLFLIGFITISIISWFVVYLKYEIHLRRFSGPTPIPVIGNVLQIGVKKDLLPSFSKLLQKYGEPLKVYIGFAPRLILADAKSVELLLSSTANLKKSNDYRYFHSWLELGLINSFGRKWKDHRKLLTPAFYFKILERFIQVFNNQGKILINKLENTTEKEPVDIVPYMTLYALDVICQSTLNKPINAQLDSNSDYVKSVKEYLRIFTERIFSIKMWDWVFSLSKDYYKEKKAVNVLHRFSNSVIKNRQLELQTKTINDLMEETVTFLDLLLTSTIDDKPLTFEEIREEVDTIIFAGQDTTASGISFTLYCISKHSHIQNKVYHEISEILGNDQENLSYKDLQKMKYLEQVIKESLRLYPIAPLITRVLTEDIILEKKIIPKNVVVGVSLYNLHRNPSLFSNPDVFDPERFSAENSKNIPLYSYVPFSAGPRNCIGQKFAMLEVKTAVCKILQKFELLPVLDHQPVLVANVILTSDNGLPIYLKHRNKRYN